MLLIYKHIKYCVVHLSVWSISILLLKMATNNTSTKKAGENRWAQNKKKSKCPFCIDTLHHTTKEISSCVSFFFLSIFFSSCTIFSHFFSCCSFVVIVVGVLSHILEGKRVCVLILELGKSLAYLWTSTGVHVYTHRMSAFYNLLRLFCLQRARGKQKKKWREEKISHIPKLFGMQSHAAFGKLSFMAARTQNVHT